MAKFKPGIPDGFSLNVEPVRDLGDYLDEPSPSPQRRPKPQAVEGGEGRAVPVATRPEPVTPPVKRPTFEAQPPQAVAQSRVPERSPTVLPEERVIPQAPPVPVEREPAVNEDRLPKPKAPRREISMTPETLRMSDELLEVIRSGSGQRDTKANELFHALVLLVHEAMDELDPHAIPKRGRWGSPTARAYPQELKNAFLRALARKHGPMSDGMSGLKYPMNGAA